MSASQTHRQTNRTSRRKSGRPDTQLQFESTQELQKEVNRARVKFPQGPEQNGRLPLALQEEAGEVAKAILNDEGIERIRAEALQTACVAMRIYEEYEV